MEDGSTVFVKIQLPVEKRLQLHHGLIDSIPLIRNEEIRGAPDGIYTWIVSDTGFAANRVVSVLELGTIHHSLVFRTFTNELFGAGELEKRGDTIRFNIQSGSYMKDFFTENASRALIVQSDFEEMMKSFGFAAESIRFDDVPYIDRERSPLTRAELDMYVAAGYEVWLFDSKESCDLFGADQILKEEIEKSEEAIRLYSGMADERFKKYAEQLRVSVGGKRALLATLESAPIVGKRYGARRGRKTRKTRKMRFTQKARKMLESNVYNSRQ